MPVLQTLKLFCRDCGWHVVVADGDLNPTIVSTCPRCGKSDIRTVRASLVERLNPIESARGAAFQIRRFFGK